MKQKKQKQNKLKQQRQQNITLRAEATFSLCELAGEK